MLRDARATKAVNNYEIVYIDDNDFFIHHIKSMSKDMKTLTNSHDL